MIPQIWSINIDKEQQHKKRQKIIFFQTYLSHTGMVDHEEVHFEGISAGALDLESILV